MKVALQTYSVRQHMRENTPATLAEVAKLGYRHLEVANHDSGKPYQGEDVGIGFGIGAKEIVALLGEVGASIMGVHLFPFPFEEDKLNAMIEYHKILGTKYFVVPNGFYRDYDEVMAAAERLEKAGRRCADAGFALLYHNHFHEWQKFRGKTVLDHLMDNTTPGLVDLEIDTVWAMMAGQDPADVLKQYGKRVRVVHQKDYAKEFEADINLLAKFRDDEDYINLDTMIGCFDHRAFTEIGSGIADIQGIIDAANEHCGSEYIVLEQDYTQLGEMESVRASMEMFKKYRGIEW